MSAASKISVIIPALKDTAALQNLLKQLIHENIFEIIIVQNEDASEKIISSSHYKLLLAPQGRGPQIQLGLDSAKGDILWIIHADSRLPENAVKSVMSIMDNPDNIMGCLPLVFNAQKPALNLFAAMSRIESALTTFGDQGFFFRAKHRSTLPQLINYPLLEDVIIRRHLKRIGRIKKTKAPLTTDARRFLRYGIWKTQWRNGLILLRFLLGASPQKLYQDYYKSY